MQDVTIFGLKNNPTCTWSEVECTKMWEKKFRDDNYCKEKLYANRSSLGVRGKHKENVNPMLIPCYPMLIAHWQLTSKILSLTVKCYNLHNGNQLIAISNLGGIPHSNFISLSEGA